MKQSPSILITASTWWPLSARLASALLQQDCSVSALCPPFHPLRLVRGISEFHDYDIFRPLHALEACIRRAEPDLVVPCDDRAVWLLHELLETAPDLRGLIERSLGDSAGFSIVRGRISLLEFARKLGILTPPARALESSEDLDAWFEGGPRRSFLKLDGTWGGIGVTPVNAYQEAVRVFEKMRNPQHWVAAIKKSIVNRDPLAFWSRRHHRVPSVSIQQHVSGTPANCMFACWGGELLGIVTVEVLSTQGPTGAATTVRVIRHAQIEEAARRLASALKLSGFHGLDFILDDQIMLDDQTGPDGTTGNAWLIELNPRSTQLGHLPLPEQGDLAGLLCARAGRRIAPLPPRTAIASETIAFFPQALAWNPDSPHLLSGYHDVPWDQPELVRELLLPPWPERRLVYRLYHLFGKPRPSPSAPAPTLQNLERFRPPNVPAPRLGRAV